MSGSHGEMIPGLQPVQAGARGPLRHGSVAGKQAVLSGAGTGRLFRRYNEPADVPIGADLSFLLDSKPRFDASPAG